MSGRPTLIFSEILGFSISRLTTPSISWTRWTDATLNILSYIGTGSNSGLSEWTVSAGSTLRNLRGRITTEIEAWWFCLACLELENKLNFKPYSCLISISYCLLWLFCQETASFLLFQTNFMGPRLAVNVVRGSIWPLIPIFWSQNGGNINPARGVGLKGPLKGV